MLLLYIKLLDDDIWLFCVYFKGKNIVDVLWFVEGG